MDKTPTGDERSKLLQGCKALIFKWASVHFKGYLAKAQEQLFRMAEKAGNNQEQAHFFHAHQQLRDHQRAVEQRLLEHLSLAFRHYLEQRDTSADLAHEDTGLALVDNAELEQSIALGTMTRRANADFADAVYALNQRLSVIGGGYKINDIGNPVAPAVFAECLQAALAQLDIENTPLLVIYKVYDGAVMTRLGKLYDLLNHDLKNKGVLTHLRYQVRKQDAPVLPEELETLLSEHTLARQTELMNTVQQLQAALMANSPQPIVVAPTPMLVRQLHPLQQQSAQRIVSLETPTAFVEQGYSAAAAQVEDQKKLANRIDADVIEIVGLVFEYVLNDEELPDSVKALLSYLHTPFLKVALLDREFFNHPQHPARLLLNSMVAAGARWVEPEGKNKSDVFQQMRAVVKRILDEFDDDVRLFSQLAFEFNQFLRQHVRRVRLAEQRATQAARGEDKLKEVRQKVEKYLQKKTENIELPAEIRTLLFEPWANVLAFNLLRFGSKSQQWRKVARSIDDILLYMRGHEPAPDPALIEERLRAGFETVGYEPDQGQRLLRALHDLHQQNRRSTRNRDAGTSDTSAAPTPSVQPLDIDTLQQETPSEDPILKRLNAMEFGTWFLFRADQPAKSQYQAKLAWYNARTQHFMFVNRLGQQIAVRLGGELANDIRAGRVRILQKNDDKPFFEKALERIAEQLRLRPR